MAYCINCGKELKSTDNYCSSCGKKIIDESRVEEISKEPKVMRCFTVFGNVGNVLGIVTLIVAFIPIWNFFAWIVGVHGIVFSVLGKKDIKQLSKCKKGLRRSIIGSILGLVLFIALIVLIALTA